MVIESQRKYLETKSRKIGSEREFLGLAERTLTNFVAEFTIHYSNTVLC